MGAAHRIFHHRNRRRGWPVGDDGSGALVRGMVQRERGMVAGPLCLLEHGAHRLDRDAGAAAQLPESAPRLVVDRAGGPDARGPQLALATRLEPGPSLFASARRAVVSRSRDRAHAASLAGGLSRLLVAGARLPGCIVV